MKKTFVIAGAVVGVIVLVVVGVLVFLVSNLDGLVKKAIETVGSEATGVKVSVGAVKISLTEGKGSITGVSIGNPQGFKTANAFSLGEISLALDTGTVTKDPVVIKEIKVGAPQVTYEMATGGSNIDAIQKNVQAFAAKAGGGGGGATKPAEKDGKAGPKLVIDRLAVSGGAVTLATPIPGAQATGKLGDITLTGIGRDKGGATPAQVAQQFLDALSKSAVQAAGQMGIGKALEGAAQKASEAAAGASGAAKGAAESATGAVKGLLGK
ncbi:MAG: hypothetical protein IT565_08515 [Rhodospirillales bacterium]|nr:hypothetical protein [Rhodospirillales bacterium]